MTTMAESKPQVVFLHGWGGSYEAVWQAHGWDVRLQEAGFDVIGLDLPGHGRSVRSHNPNDYADLATQVMPGMPKDRPVIGIGYSLGAKVLLEIATREPSIFGKLVLAGLGANVFAPEKMGEAVATVLEKGADASTHPAVRGLAEYGLKAGNDPLALAAVLRRPPNPVLSPARVNRVICETLIVAGDQDVLAMPLDPLSNELPNHKVEILPGVDHIGLPAAPAFANALMRFLAQIK